MKTILVVVFLLSSLIGFSQLKTYSGSILEMTKKEPIPGATILVYSDSNQLKLNTMTDLNGLFSIPAQPGDKLIINFIGFNSQSLVIGEKTPENITIFLGQDESIQEVVVTAFASSSASSWIGATLAYNIDGQDSENIIGSSKVKLNTSKRFTGHFRLNVIGNIAKFSGNIDTTAFRKDIREIVQSSQGLSIGLEPLYIIKEDFVNDLHIRSWVTLNYKVNQFKGVGLESTSKNVTLSQFRLTTGAEIEAIEFQDGGRLIHFGFEGAISTFSSDKYFQVFNEDRSTLFSFEWNVTVPVFGSLGFTAGQTISSGIKPVFFAGIIIGK